MAANQFGRLLKGIGSPMDMNPAAAAGAGRTLQKMVRGKKYPRQNKGKSKKKRSVKKAVSKLVRKLDS